MSKPGRNEPCHCGSGKKYKKCCMEKDAIAEKNITKNSFYEEWESEDDKVSHEYNHAESNYSESPENEIEEDEIEDNEGNEDETLFDSAEVEEMEPASVTQKEYPAISADDQELVDEWWNRLDYEKKPEEIQEHIEQFMYAHPHLVENLGLEDEVLFELGAKYKQANESDAFIRFLFYVRKEFPATYVRSAGFYDFDIIAWLIAQGRQSEIEDFLGYLKDYPVDFVEQLFDVVQLLEATDNIGPLISLASATCSRLFSSSKILGVSGIVMPLVSQVLSKYLREGFSDDDVAGFVNELTETIAPLGLRPDNNTIDYWRTTLNNILSPFTSWPVDIPKKKSQLEDRYKAISQNFRRYIHERAAISWTSAWYYSSLISDYFSEYIHSAKGKVKKQFDFSENNIDRISVVLGKKIFWPNCTKLIRSLRGGLSYGRIPTRVWQYSEGEKLKIQKDCTKLYNQVYPNFKTQFIEADFFRTFPYLV